MKKGLWLSVVLGGGLLMGQDVQKISGIARDQAGFPCIQSTDDACNLFPHSVQEIEVRLEQVKEAIRAGIAKLLLVPADKHTVQTLLEGLDVVVAQAYPDSYIFNFTKSVHPDPAVREAAEKAAIELSKFLTDELVHNKALYQLLKEYQQGVSTVQALARVDQYFLDKEIEGLEQEGLNLSDELQEQVVLLQKRCIELTFDFYRTIDEPVYLEVTDEDLVGVPDDFKRSLACIGGVYSLPMNYPTSTMIMTRCSSSETRKQYYKKFANRGYPKNESILQELIQKRHEYAKLLGYESFADYNLALQMIKTPARAWAFERELQTKIIPAAQKEFERLVADLPDGVTLSPEGKLYPWDNGYVMTSFKKKHYDIDELEFAHYFPMEKTVAGLMRVYELFFDLIIETVPVSGMWHEDVRLLRIKNKSDQAVWGYVFLDMFPREKKYGHAAAWSLIRALQKSDGTRTAGVVGVVCNFTKPTAEKPSLLQYGEVVTFFHEFGHALHTVFAATKYYSHGGTAVETDFVELPSQMLENWMEDAAVLKMVSSHYQTGEPLPDDLIQKRLELLKFGEALGVARQLTLGMFSLEVFGGKDVPSFATLWQEIAAENTPYSWYDTEAHGYCSFGHLGNYGAKYYCYLWSQAIAMDVFEQIKKEGLLNPAAGKRYVQAILGCGGSKDANVMVHDYLGREPQFDAFYKKLGF